MLLPLKHRIPEFCLVIDGKKQKGNGRFGYLDIFVLGETKGNNICIELKYISLIGLIRDTNGNQIEAFGTNELEKLDKKLEKENEKSLLDKQYVYYSKEFKKWKQTTIHEVLNNGINQLKLYMNTISKGQTTGYSTSGVCDKRIKITKSDPNNLKGFVILVVGFRRILWKSVEEVVSHYKYNKA